MICSGSGYKTYRICVVTMTEERILDVTTVTTRYQITLTKAVRKLLNVEMGDRIVFVKKGDEIVIRKA